MKRNYAIKSLLDMSKYKLEKKSQIVFTAIILKSLTLVN